MSVVKMELKGASNDVLDEVKKYITGADGKKIERAKYPLFDCDNAFTRAIVAVTVGCDVLVKGYKTKGPKQISEDIEKKEKEMNVLSEVKNQHVLNEMLISHFSEKMNISKTLLHF